MKTWYSWLAEVSGFAAARDKADRIPRATKPGNQKTDARCETIGPVRSARAAAEWERLREEPDRAERKTDSAPWRCNLSEKTSTRWRKHNVNQILTCHTDTRTESECKPRKYQIFVQQQTQHSIKSRTKISNQLSTRPRTEFSR
jgi:hypothetical protein